MSRPRSSRPPVMCVNLRRSPPYVSEIGEIGEINLCRVDVTACRSRTTVAGRRLPLDGSHHQDHKSSCGMRVYAGCK